MRRCSPLLLFVLSACATPGPQPALDAYAQALTAQDARALHGAYDEANRKERSVQKLQDKLQSEPEQARALGVALQSAPLTQYAEARLPDGRVVRLVKRGDTWRVSQGALRFAAYDTPEQALQTLVLAARAGRLDEVRAAMPQAFEDRYASDAALAAYLETVRDRLEAAWAAVAPLSPGRARVQGDAAVLRYGARSVRFVRQGSTWRVLDVE